MSRRVGKKATEQQKETEGDKDETEEDIEVKGGEGGIERYWDDIEVTERDIGTT